jgi:uncharacterized membrane protein YfcA
MEFIIILLIVLIVSIIFSIVGLGGAIIYVPLFYWLGIPLEIAIPTALLLNCITAGSASLTYYISVICTFRGIYKPILER